MAARQCPICGLVSKGDFCGYCEVSTVEVPRCINCNTEVYLREKYCTGCGLPHRRALGIPSISEVLIGWFSRKGSHGVKT